MWLWLICRVLPFAMPLDKGSSWPELLPGVCRLGASQVQGVEMQSGLKVGCVYSPDTDTNLELSNPETWISPSYLCVLFKWMACGRLSHFSLVWLFVTLCDSMYSRTYQAPNFWDSPGKNTGVGYYFLFQEIFLTWGSNPSLLFPALAGRVFTTSTTWEAL